MTKISNDQRMCIEACRNCAATCTETLSMCLHEGGEHVQEDHVRVMLDCIEICELSARYMLRNSPRHALTCGVCAEVCYACADDCQLMDESFMQQCADECRRCSDLCQKMASAMS